MRTKSTPTFDWRDAAPYAPLLRADRSLFAWEWLRRDPDYRASASLAAPGGGAAAFGLAAFESPDLTVPLARPLWCAEALPLVLPVEPAAARAGDAFCLDRFSQFATVLRAERTEHLLLSDGLRMIRLDAPPGTFRPGSVGLRYRIEGLARAKPLVLTLRRFLALARTGQFARSLHNAERRARRWILLLRTFDALSDGASQREIAETLSGRSVATSRWRSREPSLRSQVQRLVRGACALAAGGYRDLLGTGAGGSLAD